MFDATIGLNAQTKPAAIGVAATKHAHNASKKIIVGFAIAILAAFNISFQTKVMGYILSSRPSTKNPTSITIWVATTRHCPTLWTRLLIGRMKW